MPGVCEIGTHEVFLEFQSESNFSYYRARYYDPPTGRFTSEDPIGFNAKQFHFYSYVSNNPVRFADPFGLCPQLDSVSKYHLDCQRIPTAKDRCSCHAVYVPNEGWQDFMDKCTVCSKKDAKPVEICLCQCRIVKTLMPERMNRSCEDFCKAAFK
jgi:RHS repeat-associated protein